MLENCLEVNQRGTNYKKRIQMIKHRLVVTWQELYQNIKTSGQAQAGVIIERSVNAMSVAGQTALELSGPEDQDQKRLATRSILKIGAGTKSPA